MGEDYEEALRTRAKESAMIVSLANEMDIPAEYISDSIIPIQIAPPVITSNEQENSQTESTQVDSQQTDLADQNKPNKGMIAEALKGLEWRRKYNRGGTAIGVARARDISNGKNLSDDTVKRMHSYFSRHEVDKKGKGFTPDEEGFPSAGRIAWALWGGDSGQIWAADKVEKMKSQLAIKAKEYKVELKRDEFGKIVGFEKVNIDISTPDSTETEG
jgi:hypothetical protein